MIGEELFCIDHIQRKSTIDRNFPKGLKFKGKILHIIYTEIIKLREVFYIIYTDSAEGEEVFSPVMYTGSF